MPGLRLYGLQMESVFDIASHRELVALLGDRKHPGDANLFDFEREVAAANPDYGLHLLACLHHLRGEYELAEKVASSIRDEQTRLDTTLLVSEFQVA